MAKSQEQITQETFRELTYQSPGFWSRMFRRGMSVLMPDFQPKRAPLFDNIISRLGSRNSRNITQYAKDAQLEVKFPQKAADHFLRTLLQGAEALGATADELNKVEWESVDFRDLMTGNPDEWFDFSKIPNLGQKLTGIFNQIGKHIDSRFMEQIGMSYPDKKGERVQSGTDVEEQRKRQREELDALFDKINKGMDQIAGREAPDAMGRSASEEFFNRLARYSGAEDIADRLKSDFTADEEGILFPASNDAKDRINTFIEEVFGKRSASNSLNILRKAVGASAPILNKAGNKIFDMLPGFVKRPILLAAGNAGAASAKAAGMGLPQQMEAAAAAMNAAKIATSFKVVQALSRILAEAAKKIADVFRYFARAGEEMVAKVTNYNGALAFAQANFERNEKLREIQAARELSKAGEALINARDRLAEAMHPINVGEAELGAETNAWWTDMRAEGFEGFNRAKEVWDDWTGLTMVSGLAGSIYKLLDEKLPFINVIAGIMKKLGASVDLIVEYVEPEGRVQLKDGAHAFGPAGMPMRDWFDAMLPNRQQQNPRRVPPVVPQKGG